MTIIVEREALLRVLTRESSESSSISCGNAYIPSDGEYVLVNMPKPSLREESVEKSPTFDDQSTCSFSTDSSLSTNSYHSLGRRITFAETLVTDEWTRPRTPKDQVSSLFYSTEETQRFRREYRMERKFLCELSLDADCHDLDSDDISKLLATSSSFRSHRHRISRVVVMHDDSFETFLNEQKEEPLSGESFDNDCFWSGSLTWY